MKRMDFGKRIQVRQLKRIFLRWNGMADEYCIRMKWMEHNGTGQDGLETTSLDDLAEELQS